MRNSLNILVALSAATFLATSCNDDIGPAQPTANMPKTYAFENVDYSGQTQRIKMLDTLQNYAKSGTSQAISYANLVALYENTPTLFGTDKNLKSKTHSSFLSVADELFLALESNSKDEVRATRLKDGYLLTTDGQEPVQILVKGLMGAVMYNQATDVYFSDSKVGSENPLADIQHHWDEAFGYFGAPTDFPATTEGAKYWAHYTNQRAEAFDVRQSIMDAFIKGRHAINQGNIDSRTEAIASIRQDWEKLIAANVIHYVRDVINRIPATEEAIDMSYDGKLYHHWSEAKGFAYGLAVSSADSRVLTVQEYTDLMTYLGTSPTATTRSNLQSAATLLQQAYGFTTQEFK